MTVTTSPSAGGNAVSKGGDASPPVTVEQVSLTIDGVEVSVPKNTLVIRAAEEWLRPARRAVLELVPGAAS